MTLDEAIESLWDCTIDLCKESLEWSGYDMGVTKNNKNYFNYLADNPIEFRTESSLGDYGANDLTFGLVPGDPGDTGLSDGMLNFVCQYETGHKFGYNLTSKDINGYDLGDAGGHRTFGYGLLYHPNGKYMDTIKGSWTKEELENLFKIHAKEISGKIDKWAQKNNITLKQSQKDAIASGCYNFGIGFLNKNVCKMIIADPNNPEIKNVWAHLSDVQGKKYPGLIKRRQAEAQWYFS